MEGQRAHTSRTHIAPQGQNGRVRVTQDRSTRGNRGQGGNANAPSPATPVQAPDVPVASTGAPVPEGTGSRNGATVTATLEQAIERKRAAVVQASNEVIEAAALVAEVAELPDTNKAKILMVARHTAAVEAHTRLVASLAQDEKSSRTFGLVAPLIAAFGTDGKVEVEQSGDVRTGSIALVDVPATLAKAKDAARAALANLNAINALATAIAAAGIGEDVIADFRPVRFEADGEHAIKLAVSAGSAARASGGTGGTRASGRNLVEITGAATAGWDVYVGSKIGTGGDYASFTALGADAHTKGLITDERDHALKFTANGDARSVSWRAEMIKAGGLTVTEIAAPESSEGSAEAQAAPAEAEAVTA